MSCVNMTNFTWSCYLYLRRHLFHCGLPRRLLVSVFHSDKQYARTTANSSAIFISKNNLSRVIVQPRLELKARLNDLDREQDNIRRRCLDMDVAKLAADIKALEPIEKEWVVVNRQMEKLLKSLRKIDQYEKEGRDMASTKQRVEEKKSEIHLLLDKIETEFDKQLEPVMLTGLKLPSHLHPLTPEISGVAKTSGEIPAFQFSVADHMSLGERNKTILPGSIDRSYYFCGDVAEFEQNVTAWYESELVKAGFTFLLGPDMAKSFVAEGCGLDFWDPEQVYMLQIDLDHRTPEPSLVPATRLDMAYILSGVGPVFFAGFMARMRFESHNLPMRVFSIGPHYHPGSSKASNMSGLFSAIQTNRVGMCSVAVDHQAATLLYDEMLEVCWRLVTCFELPLRLVEVGADSLQHYESRRADLQVWLPSVSDYCTIGWVSQCDNFISDRLMILTNPNLADHSKPPLEPLYHVFGTATILPRLIAAYMENHQTQDGKYSFPFKMAP